MCSIVKGVLKNFAKFTGKHLCQSLFFNKNAGLRPAALLKKRLLHRCVPVNFAKFLRIPFYRTPMVAASTTKNNVTMSNSAHHPNFNYETS